MSDSLDTDSDTDIDSDIEAGIRLIRPAGLVSSPVFSHVAIVPAGATTVYIGGQNAVDADGQLVGGDDAAAQTTRTMENLIAALAAADLTYDDVISVTLLIAEGVDLRAAYGAAMPFMAGAGDPPLVTAAVVKGLAVPGALIEVSAVAAVIR